MLNLKRRQFITLIAGRRRGRSGTAANMYPPKLILQKSRKNPNI
jgi:hypothetical protein